MAARQMLRTGFIVLLCVLPFGAACGNVTASGDGGGGGGGAGGVGGAGAGGSDAAIEMAPLTADAACDQYAQAFCGALQSCTPVLIPFYYGTLANCVDRAKLQCMTDQMSPGITRTPDDLATCANDAASASCADLIAGQLPASCANKPGTVANGASCGSSWQCASTHCEMSSSGSASSCGTCAVRQPVNGSCTVDEGCTSGLVCANGKCAMPVGVGTGCSNNVPCRGDLYCDKTTQVCSTHVGANASCASDANACDLASGYACNPSTQVCNTVGVGQGGDPCGLINGALTICTELDACSGATLTKAGVCASPAQDGTACDDNQHCVPPATCVNHLCRLPSASSCS